MSRNFFVRGVADREIFYNEGEPSTLKFERADWRFDSDLDILSAKRGVVYFQWDLENFWRWVGMVEDSPRAAATSVQLDHHVLDCVHHLLHRR
jgi:hypothetical protein